MNLLLLLLRNIKQRFLVKLSALVFTSIKHAFLPTVFSESPLNMDTWTIRTLHGIVPLVSVLTGFHCIINFMNSIRFGTGKLQVFYFHHSRSALVSIYFHLCTILIYNPC